MTTAGMGDEPETPKRPRGRPKVRHDDRHTQADIDRFLGRIDKSDPSGCWLWTAGTTSNGYGTTWWWPQNGNVLAHRVAWTLWRGPIPAGLVLDHLCSVRRCVNPAHLEPVTQTENHRRAEARRPPPTVTRQLAAGVVWVGCPAGKHGDGAGVLGVNPDGRPFCRLCRREKRKRIARAKYERRGFPPLRVAGVPHEKPEPSP